MKNVKFIIGVGAQKAGTTLLFNLLSKSNEIDVAVGNEFKSKELHYFSRVEKPNYEDYISKFKNKNIYKLDITPDYMFYPKALERIKEILPEENVKIIAILRNPIRRAESHYYMSRRRGIERLKFEEAFALEKERMKVSALNFGEMSYFERGKYYSQVKRLYEFFPSENIMIIIFEEFIKSQRETVIEICEFLGISKMIIEPMHAHEGYDVRFKFLPKFFNVYGPRIEKSLPPKIFIILRNLYRDMNRKKVRKNKIDVSFSRKLERYFLDDIKKLEVLIHKDLSHWYSKN